MIQLRVVVFFAWTVQCVVSSCWDPYFSANGSCYFISNDALNAGQAEHQCEIKGARLVEIESQEKQDLVADLLKQRQVKKAWVAGRTKYVVNYYVWLDGSEPFIYNNWNTISRSGPSPPLCVYLVAKHDYQWKAHSCNKKHIYICEREQTLSVVFLALTVRCVVSECLPHWISRNGICYFLSNHAASSYKAEEYCSFFRGKMVEIKSPEKQIFLARLLKIYKVKKAWIGARSMVGTTPFVIRRTYTPLYYTNWVDGQEAKAVEPNPQRCVFMQASIGYRWLKHSCKREHRFICEREESSSGMLVYVMETG